MDIHMSRVTWCPVMCAQLTYNLYWHVCTLHKYQFNKDWFMTHLCAICQQKWIKFCAIFMNLFHNSQFVDHLAVTCCTGKQSSVMNHRITWEKLKIFPWDWVAVPKVMPPFTWKKCSLNSWDRIRCQFLVVLVLSCGVHPVSCSCCRTAKPTSITHNVTCKHLLRLNFAACQTEGWGFPQQPLLRPAGINMFPLSRPALQKVAANFLL